MASAIPPSRQDEYCSGTSAALTAVMESNTDVQCPYRSPLTKLTHDTECTSMHVHPMTQCCTPAHQLAYTVNKMFTTSESKGI
eukprot:6963048-Karenia_brevis.AAC.1